MIFNVIAWIVFGTIAGRLASLINQSNNSQDALDDVLVGIVGALIGGFMASTLTGSNLTAFSVGSVVIAVCGAVTLLIIKQAVRRQHTTV